MMPHFADPVIPPGPGVFYTCTRCNTHNLRPSEVDICRSANKRNPHKGERLCLPCLALVCGDA